MGRAASGQPTTSRPSTRFAFDDIRPPAPELVDDCVHCGFCLPTCPTYVLWGEEMDSPRGRIVLMKSGLEEASELSSEMVSHFDRCLGCMACVTACPSGVQYDKLIEATRPQVERNYRRPAFDRLLRKLLFATFTYPGRLRAMLPLLAAAKAMRLDRMMRRVPADSRLASFVRMLELAPTVPLRAARARLPERTPARTDSRARVGLLQGCIQRVFFSDVNRATAEVLGAEGFDVFAPASVRCCGALMFHSGYEEDALALAKEMIESFEDCDYVVVNAAGCGSSMKDYGHVLADDPVWGERAQAFSTKVRDVTELLADGDPVAPRHPLEIKVAYHDACHLAHAQQVRAQPRSLLSTIPGLELIEPAEWEICCGSAGIYNLLQPSAAEELGARKAKNLMATKAQVIAAGNPGCALQIALYLRRAGRELPIHHPIELLHASIFDRRL
ncbi:MAG TPA: heterodisulfide reductase-related iron-sulfur binding cluster [Actinomycetota bacterium]|nr:heterodisulfide reductase-related iron-sulfur binding cluster [Actinomycetota bacterium]